MKTQIQVDHARDLEEDILDNEKSVKSAGEELEEAKKYLAKQKIYYYTESIIRLRDYLKEIGE